MQGIRMESVWRKSCAALLLLPKPKVAAIKQNGVLVSDKSLTALASMPFSSLSLSFHFELFNSQVLVGALMQAVKTLFRLEITYAACCNVQDSVV